MNLESLTFLERPYYYFPEYLYKCSACNDQYLARSYPLEGEGVLASVDITLSRIVHRALNCCTALRLDLCE